MKIVPIIHAHYRDLWSHTSPELCANQTSKTQEIKQKYLMCGSREPLHYM